MPIEKVSDDIKRKLPVGTQIVFNKDLPEPTSAGAPAKFAARDGMPGKIIGTERPGSFEMYWVSSGLRPAFQVHIDDFDVQGHVVRGADIRARACL